MKPADVAPEFVLRRCRLSARAIDGVPHIGKAD